jgi:radical SAM superfamily enzyme YgiQ (UPF0313 family)
MLTLINTNRLAPPIAPIGLDYVGSALRSSGVDVELVDLSCAEDSQRAIAEHFADCEAELVGLSFRNVDDCFWPSGQSYLESLKRDLQTVRRHSDAPIVLGGVGYSIFPHRILEETGADFGIWGDGEPALAALVAELRGRRRFERIPGLVYCRDGELQVNRAAWPKTLEFSSQRDFVDNRFYFRHGGQMGIETKRGCPRQCIYCVDPLTKGRSHRLRPPETVADELEALLAQEVDVLHLCDPEFNLPLHHALQVCREIVRRQLGSRIRWYAYLAVTPFPEELAACMARAGCAGINFTSDAAHAGMLATYRQLHRYEHLKEAVTRCRRYGIATMLDMLLGGPGETPETAAESIEAFRRLDPDCAGAALGVRIYPGTGMAEIAAAEGPWEENGNLRRHYRGPIDLLQPTFYISSALGTEPARLVRDLIGDDPRFFPPALEGPSADSDDHNYGDNQLLARAIADGQRGAYWHILRRLRDRQHASD